MLRQRQSDRSDDYVVERHLVLIAHLRQLRAHLGSTRRIEFGGEEKCGDWTIRLREPARDRLPDLSERDVLEVTLGREPVSCGGPCGTTRRFRVLYVALDDATPGARALDSAELDSLVVREPSSERRRARPPPHRSDAGARGSIS